MKSLDFHFYKATNQAVAITDTHATQIFFKKLPARVDEATGTISVDFDLIHQRLGISSAAARNGRKEDSSKDSDKSACFSQNEVLHITLNSTYS
jgi:hypothetical protein